jgi:two-component system chemotaxis response regulator CheB
MGNRIKVLIVDDSALMRQQLTLLLSKHPSIEVIGSARDGREGVEKAIRLQPDVVTMDIHMPTMDGITALQYVMEIAPRPVIILSAYSRKGALVTFEALELGAFDYVTKPEVMGAAEMRKTVDLLVERIVAAASGSSRTHSRPDDECAEEAEERGDPFRRAVVIGASTGGPRAVEDIVRHLPPDLPAPVFLVQHMPPLFTSSFAERLNEKYPIKTVEGAHRMPVEPGTVYVAPGGKHMTVEKVLGKQQDRIAIGALPKETVFKPSVDVTMMSLLEQLPASKLIGVLLTGIGSDGAQAMVEIKKRGGFTIAEAEETAVVYGMPRAAAEMGGASVVLPYSQIGRFIVGEVMRDGS